MVAAHVTDPLASLSIREELKINSSLLAFVHDPSDCATHEEALARE
jgi:hypothetical protein